MHRCWWVPVYSWIFLLTPSSPSQFLALLTKSDHRLRCQIQQVKIQGHWTKFKFQISSILKIYKYVPRNIWDILIPDIYLLFLWCSHFTWLLQFVWWPAIGLPQGFLLRTHNEPTTFHGLLEQLDVSSFWKLPTRSSMPGLLVKMFSLFADLYFPRFLPWLCKAEFSQYILYFTVLIRCYSLIKCWQHSVWLWHKGVVIISVSQEKKLWYKEVKLLAQSHTSGE